MKVTGLVCFWSELFRCGPENLEFGTKSGTGYIPVSNMHHPNIMFHIMRHSEHIRSRKVDLELPSAPHPDSRSLPDPLCHASAYATG